MRRESCGGGQRWNVSDRLDYYLLASSDLSAKYSLFYPLHSTVKACWKKDCLVAGALKGVLGFIRGAKSGKGRALKREGEATQMSYSPTTPTKIRD